MEESQIEFIRLNRKERRTELEKYYKKVKICKMCRKRYGLDLIQDDDGICPICTSKVRNV